MPAAEKQIYEFGPFRIDSVERLLYRHAEMIPLTPKVVDTLLALVSNAGRVVEKEELLRIIWPDSFVEEGGLARNISLLRKVFENGEGGAQFIETIPKRGYRFVGLSELAAPVSEPPAPARAMAIPDPVTPAIALEPQPSRIETRRDWVGPLVLLAAVLVFGYYWLNRPPHIRSLVVLPLTDLSNDAVLAEGVHDEINNALGKIGSLHVISQITAMTYQGARKPIRAIAQELGVDAAIEGTVRQVGDRVLISIQLIEAKTESAIWASSWEKDLRDVLALEREVATAIADEVRVQLTPNERQSLAGSRAIEPQAFKDYLRGRFYWNKRTGEGVQKAIEYFQKAIARDPGYALPHAGLADALAELSTNGVDAMAPDSVMPKAKTAALQAVALDEQSAEAHASLGNVKMAYDWDLAGAQREFQRAVDLNPGYATAHHWYAHYWLAMGQTDQALREIHLAQDLDPLSLVINVGVGFCLYHAGKFDEAIEQYRSTVAMDPSFPLAHNTLGMALQAKKLYPEAIAEFSKALSLPGSAGLALAGLGTTYASWDKPQEARQVLLQMDQAAQKQYVPAMYRSVVYAALGDKEQALEWARRAYVEHSDYMIHLKTEPWAAPMRTDSRFLDLLNQVARGRR